MSKLRLLSILGVVALILLSVFLSVVVQPHNASANTRPKAFIFIRGIGTASNSSDPHFIPDGINGWGSVHTELVNAYPNAKYYGYSYKGIGKWYFQNDTFQSLFEDAKSLDEYITNPELRGYDIYLIGHSLGGAIGAYYAATYYNQDIYQKDFDVRLAGVITYDSPLHGVNSNARNAKCFANGLLSLGANMGINVMQDLLPSGFAVSRMQASGGHINIASIGNIDDCFITTEKSSLDSGNSDTYIGSGSNLPFHSGGGTNLLLDNPSAHNSILSYGSAIAAMLSRVSDWASSPGGDPTPTPSPTPPSGGSGGGSGSICTNSPTFTNPPDGAKVERSVNLAWNAPSSCIPDGYSFRINQSSDTEAKPWIVDTGVGPENYAYTFSSDGTYYVHVRACKTCTPYNPGPWTTIRIVVQQGGGNPPPQPNDGIKICQNANDGNPCSVFTYTGSNDTVQSLGSLSLNQDSLQFLGSYSNSYDVVLCLKAGCLSGDREVMHDDPNFASSLTQNQYVALRIVKLTAPPPPPTDGVQVFQNGNYSGPSQTFTYSGNTGTCYTFNNDLYKHQDSVRFLGSYVGNFDAVFSAQTNCSTGDSEIFSDKSDFGLSANQFTTIRLVTLRATVGTWNSPSDNFTVDQNGMLHFSANVAGFNITKVNFRATWNGTPWIDDLCSMPVNNSQVYTCDWNPANNNVAPNTQLRVAFDAYDTNGTKVLSSPDGDKLGIYAPPTTQPLPVGSVVLGGMPNLDGYCTSTNQPGASVAHGVWYCGNGSVLMDMNKACQWTYNNNAFGHQDSAGNPYTWNCYTLHFISPQGTWNSPSDNFTVAKNGTLHFSANVVGSNVAKVNFRADWNGTWVDDICSLPANDTHVYTCDWNIAANNIPDNTFIRTAFDAYDTNGTKILSSPAGDKNGTYALPQVLPPGSIKLGGLNINTYCLSINQPSAHVVNGDWYCGSSSVLADMDKACQWTYDRNAFGYQDIAGNPSTWNCYTLHFLPPQGIWNKPTNNFTVAKNGVLHLSATIVGSAAWGMDFRVKIGASWQTICTMPIYDTTGYEYTCDWFPTTTSTPENAKVQIGYDVYSSRTTKILSSPENDRVGVYAPTPKVFESFSNGKNGWVLTSSVAVTTNNSSGVLRFTSTSRSATAEKTVNTAALAPYNTITIRMNLHGATLPSGASAQLFLDQGGVKYIPLSIYVKQKVNGWQKVTVPLSSFKGFTSSKSFARLGFSLVITRATIDIGNITFVCR